MKKQLMISVFIGILPVISYGQILSADLTIAQWSFDNRNANNQTEESISKKKYLFEGYYDAVNGIKNRSWKLDGYSSVLKGEPIFINENIKTFNIEAWIALQSYPWNWSAMINQGVRYQTEELKNDSVSYDFFFGVNALGQLGFKIKLNGELFSCVSSQKLPLLFWNNVVATFNNRSGIKIFINGILSDSLEVKGTVDSFEGNVLWLGKNIQKLGPVGSERKASEAIGSDMVIHGLIDEVSISNNCLSETEIENNYRLNTPKENKPLSFNKLPAGHPNLEKKFDACYTRLNYAPDWESLWRVDERPDILVHFDKSPVRYVFWRGTGYGGVWITENGIWMADQSLERAGKGKSSFGCSEHMSDKQARFSQVRIIEKNNARIIIHWRYALSDIMYNIFGAKSVLDLGEWADEYYYIYPDGISTRYQILWTNHLSHEWQETIVINQPGNKPEDNIEIEALTLANQKGDFKTYTWENGAPKTFKDPENINIQMVNLKSVFKPFIIYEEGVKIKPFQGPIRSEYSKFPWWNHWPVAQIPNDGRLAFGVDRPSHSSLSQAVENSNVIHKNDNGSYYVVSLTGMTNNHFMELIPISKSWNNPPELIIETDNIKLIEYSKKQRSYILQKTKEDNKKIQFTLLANNNAPMVNPVFVIKNWSGTKPAILLNKKKLIPNIDYRMGCENTLKGVDLVIWINTNLEKETTFVFDRYLKTNH
jgi:hypothetical protein